MRIASLAVGILAALAMAGCSASRLAAPPLAAANRQDGPSREIVSRIERHLITYRCVSDLNRWARFYRWPPRPQKVIGSLLRSVRDRRDEVEVILREAGKFGYVAGSFIEPSPPPPRRNELYIEQDHRDYLVAFGTYDPITDTLTLYSCGPNLGRR